MRGVLSAGRAAFASPGFACGGAAAAHAQLVRLPGANVALPRPWALGEELAHDVLGQEQAGVVEWRADSVRRKRKSKMNKHKHKKRRKLNRHRR